MTDSDTLAKALADVRQRRMELQSEHERLTAELSKLRLAEKSLAAIVEGTDAIEAGALPTDLAETGGAPRGRTGPRGPRANSAKGRLRALLLETGPQGLSHAEIGRRLPDVAPATLNAYLSSMSSGGEIIRNGDFYRMETEQADSAEDAQADGDETEEDFETE